MRQRSSISVSLGLVVLFGGWLGIAGVSGSDSLPSETTTLLPSSDAADSFEIASSHAMDGDLSSAFAALESSLLAGYQTPSDVLRSNRLRGLLDSSEWRPRVRDLLKASARESEISMVRNDEPGEPMVLTILIVGGHREPPLAVEPPFAKSGVVVGLVQVNDAGHYRSPDEGQDWNPRHFGFGVTNGTGAIVIHTVRPGYYAPEYGAPEEPSHAHYNVEDNGVLLRASEFFFEDDPRLTSEVRQRAERNRVPIASIARDGNGVWRAEVTIPVRGLR